MKLSGWAEVWEVFVAVSPDMVPVVVSHDEISAGVVVLSSGKIHEVYAAFDNKGIL